MERKLRIGFGLSWAVAILVAGPATVLAGPNLVAVGFFDLPPKRALARYSLEDPKVVYFTFTGDHDFGRVVVRSDTPRVLVKRDLQVYYTGSRGGAPGALVINLGDSSLQNPQIWIEFKLKGELRPGRTYEYEFEGGTDKEIKGGVPAVMPAFWADGKPHGAEVSLTEPPPTGGKIQRNRYIRGTVQIDSFDRMTSPAKIVFKLPEGFGRIFAVQRLTFREIDEEIPLLGEAEMPVPVNYIPIKSAVEGQIEEALRLGKETFVRFQENNPDRFWNTGDLEGSITLTATVVGALGELNDPKLRRNVEDALDWLSKQEPPKDQFFQVPTVANRLIALSRYGDPEKYRKATARDVAFLTGAQYDTGGWSAVSWSDQSEQARQVDPDNETSGVAVYALREATFAGVPCRRSVWSKARQYWVGAQAKNGGFRQKLEQYGGLGENVTPGRTAGGLAAMAATLEMGSGPGNRSCRAFLSIRPLHDGINSAIGYLNRRYDFEYAGAALGQLGAVNQLNPFATASLFVDCGTITGIHIFNGKNHFRREAERLFNPRNRLYQDGVFGGSLAFTAATMHTLAMGASPTVLERIVVGGDNPDRYELSGDAQHLVRYLMTQRKRPFNWRRTTIDRDVREWLEVPMLYLNVVGPVTWGSEELRKIRTYCFNGGSVIINVIEAQADQRAVVASKLREAFPEYELRDLPADHPVLDIRQKIDKPLPMKVLGNGVRDFLFLTENDGQGDWSCDWHTYRTGKDGVPERFQFVDNLLEYTIDGNKLRSSFAGSTYLSGAASLRDFGVAAMEVGGDVPVYPDMLDTLDVAMRTYYRTRITNAGTSRAPLLWVLVTGDKPLTDAQKKRILDHIHGGGYLLVDVVTGNEGWAEAALAAIRGLSSDVATRKLGALHAIYTGKIEGTRGFDARSGPLRKALTSELVHNGRNDFSAIHYRGQEVGVFSAYDLASGLQYDQFPGCRGLIPEEARKLVINTVLHAMIYERNH